MKALFIHYYYDSIQFNKKTQKNIKKLQCLKC